MNLMKCEKCGKKMIHTKDSVYWCPFCGYMMNNIGR